MKILLDTNIIIHREATKVINQDIGNLFKWLDKLKYIKCIHPVTIEEIKRNKDAGTVKTFNVKLQSYNLLQTEAPFEGEIEKISLLNDKNPNDVNDSKILNEVYKGRVDYLISEDKKIHFKAHLLNIGEKVFKIDSFLEKVNAENPELVDYRVLAVKKSYFGEISLEETFFDSFREDYLYPPFDSWFNKKSDEVAYTCLLHDKLSAFLYIKTEEAGEAYQDINPPFEKKKRLKIGTFKVTSNGFKIGERFLKIIFDNALVQHVDEIYVTIFDKRPEQLRLISLLEDWGFKYHGVKSTKNGIEQVYIRGFSRLLGVDVENPKLTFPFFSTESPIFLAPIYPAYHTELLPDSYLNNESPMDYIENEPYRNALSKVYITRSYEKNLNAGDIILFYRTKSSSGSAIFTSVITTLGIVESVIKDIETPDEFVSLCRKRSVFSDEELLQHWNYNKSTRPFIVNFLYTYSFPNRPNLKWLIENGIINDVTGAPRGFTKISKQDFLTIMKYAKSK